MNGWETEILSGVFHRRCFLRRMVAVSDALQLTRLWRAPLPPTARSARARTLRDALVARSPSETLTRSKRARLPHSARSSRAWCPSDALVARSPSETYALAARSGPKARPLLSTLVGKHCPGALRNSKISSGAQLQTVWVPTLHCLLSSSTRTARCTTRPLRRGTTDCLFLSLVTGKPCFCLAAAMARSFRCWLMDFQLDLPLGRFFLDGGFASGVSAFTDVSMAVAEKTNSSNPSPHTQQNLE